MRKWGAYHNGILCCTGTKREMQNKVDNELRGPLPRGWKARPVPSWMTKMSPKRKAEKPVYDRDAAQFLKEHPRCEFIRFGDGTPAPRLYRRVKPFAMQCLRRSTQVHHVRRRGKWYLDKRYWFPSCGDEIGRASCRERV